MYGSSVCVLCGYLAVFLLHTEICSSQPAYIASSSYQLCDSGHCGTFYCPQNQFFDQTSNKCVDYQYPEFTDKATTDRNHGNYPLILANIPEDARLDHTRRKNFSRPRPSDLLPLSMDYAVESQPDATLQLQSRNFSYEMGSSEVSFSVDEPSEETSTNDWFGEEATSLNDSFAEELYSSIPLSYKDYFVEEVQPLLGSEDEKSTLSYNSTDSTSDHGAETLKEVLSETGPSGIDQTLPFEDNPEPPLRLIDKTELPIIDATLQFIAKAKSPQPLEDIDATLEPYVASEPLVDRAAVDNMATAQTIPNAAETSLPFYNWDTTSLPLVEPPLASVKSEQPQSVGSDHTPQSLVDSDQQFTNIPFVDYDQPSLPLLNIGSLVEIEQQFLDSNQTKPPVVESKEQFQNDDQTHWVYNNSFVPGDTTPLPMQSVEPLSAESDSVLPIINGAPTALPESLDGALPFVSSIEIVPPVPENPDADEPFAENPATLLPFPKNPDAENPSPDNTETLLPFPWSPDAALPFANATETVGPVPDSTENALPFANKAETVPILPVPDSTDPGQLYPDTVEALPHSVYDTVTPSETGPLFSDSADPDQPLSDNDETLPLSVHHAVPPSETVLSVLDSADPGQSFPDIAPESPDADQLIAHNAQTPLSVNDTAMLSEAVLRAPDRADASQPFPDNAETLLLSAYDAETPSKTDPRDPDSADLDLPFTDNAPESPGPDQPLPDNAETLPLSWYATVTPSETVPRVPDSADSAFSAPESLDSDEPFAENAETLPLSVDEPVTPFETVPDRADACQPFPDKAETLLHPFYDAETPSATILRVPDSANPGQPFLEPFLDNAPESPDPDLPFADNAETVPLSVITPSELPSVSTDSAFPAPESLDSDQLFEDTTTPSSDNLSTPHATVWAQKAISAGNAKDQLLEDGKSQGDGNSLGSGGKFWATLPVRTHSTKTKANWTTTLLNGEPLHTDISVYQSPGRSYTFRVPGALPSPMPGGIINWIRQHSHKYPQKEIDYQEYGTVVEVYKDPPRELPTRCGTKFLDKLSGGLPSPIEENPWQIAVLRRQDELYVCGGAIITRRHVLSAAHCFKRNKMRYAASDILLRAGDYDKEVQEESQIDLMVETLALHHKYDKRWHLDDIAILATSEDIIFSSHVYPICLPDAWSEYTPGLVCTVSGWGQGLDNVPTRYLRSGQVSIVSKADCSAKTIFSKGVPPEMFCAEDPTKRGIDTCLGDSGGPFACSQNGTYYLYGITAFGSYPCGQDIPSFYTNVSHYKLWILRMLTKTGVSTPYNSSSLEMVPANGS